MSKMKRVAMDEELTLDADRIEEKEDPWEVFRPVDDDPDPYSGTYSEE